MTPPVVKEKNKVVLPYPMITPQERLAIWEKARGLWKNKKPDPIRTLKKLRKGWERKLT